MLSTPSLDEGGRKARVVADHDDDQDHEEEEQQQVELPLPKPPQHAGCCPRHRWMQEEESPESGPIVTMMKIMMWRSSRLE